MDRETEKWTPASESDLPALVQGLAAYRRADAAEAQALIAGDLRVRWGLLADAAKGPVVIGLDTSGSMRCPVPGYRRV